MIQTYRGFIGYNAYSEENEGLRIGDDILSACLEEYSGKLVVIRYYISDIELSKQELLEDTIHSLSGSLYATHGARYSEITGYLWTDDITEINNHDLLGELSDYEGKFIHLEVEIK